MSITSVFVTHSVALLLGTHLTALLVLPALAPKTGVEYLETNINQLLVADGQGDAVFGYEPPPDIGKPKRTSSSGGRFANPII